jgi:hypothetical protein
MGPQNLNNYYFNKLDARLDYSNYYDFFLAADERDYNGEVIYSPYIMCVWDHLDDYLHGIPFPSDCLGFWIDLNSTGSTWQPNLKCNQYDEDNTLLSLCYWEKATPKLHNAKCSCPKCENSSYTAYTNFVSSICDVGLTGIDNSLVRYMSGNTTEYDWCLKKFISLSAFTGTVTGQTLPLSGICYFSATTWSTGTPPQIINGSGFTYPCNGGPLTSTGTSTNNNFDEVKNNLSYSGCCLFTGGSAYELVLSNAAIIASGTTPNLGVFVAKTNINLGYLKVPCQMESLKLWVDMPQQYKYDHLHYDRRFKMKQITGFTQHRTDYNIVSVTGETEGYYQQLYGGFYQGFYSLDGYPYQVLPERPECGWTVECLLKIRTGTTICTGFTNTLNSHFPKNAGFFYYLGTRAENKFHNYYSAETNLFTCDQSNFSCSGNSTPLVVSATTYSGCPPKAKVIKSTYDSKVDVLSNSFGLRLTPWDEHAQTGYTLCYRAIYYTGACITTYTKKTIIDCKSNVTRTYDDCITGLTYSSGYTVVEKCSPMVCGLSGATYRAQEPWLLVSARFRRDFCYEGCDLLNMGGVNDLIYIPVEDTDGYIDSGIGNATVSLVREAPLMPGFKDQGNKVAVTGHYNGPHEPGTDCTKSKCPPSSGCTSNYTKLIQKIRFSKLWSDDRGFRKGTLTLFVNGRPVFVDDDFEEIIPRRLNTEHQKQVAVPFNISWGGGSQGLYENLTFSTSDSGTTVDRCPPYVQDPNDLNLLIEKYFAGTYDGGISQIRQYIRPLGNDEIIHNFLVNKDRYGLIDCVKECTICDPCPVLYLLECESLDIILTYASGTMSTVAVNKLSEYIMNPPYVGVKFISVMVDNVVSYTITKYCCEGTGVGEIVTTPFKALPDDVIKVTIDKFCPKEAKVTLIGTLYK